MPWEQLAIFLSYALISIMTWIIKSLWDAVQKLKVDMTLLQTDLGKNYVPRNEIREMFKEIIAELHRLSDKVDAHLNIHKP